MILPDMQVPYQDDASLASVEKYMALHRFDELLYLGDFLDFDVISHFNKEKPRKTEGARIIKDYQIANKILDRHQKIIKKNNPNAKFTLLEGNHEERIERYINEHPELEGMLEVEIGLHLAERGFNWVRCWSEGDIYKIGKAYFTHGLYTNQYHAAKMVNAFGTNIFYGHTHDIQFFPKVLRGKNRTLEGGSLGCLCEYDLSYVKGNPTNWQQAFSIMHVLPSGYFNLYITKIFNSSFVGPDGKFYKP